MTLSLAECQEDVLLSNVTELITDLQYEMEVLDSVSALHRTAQQSHVRLLLHNLIHYRKTCVFLSMTEFNLLEKLLIALPSPSYSYKMHTLRADWVTVACLVHF